MSVYTKRNKGGVWYLLRDGIILKGGFRDEATIDRWLMFYDNLPATKADLPNEKLALARQIKNSINEEDANMVVRFADELASAIIKENERRAK